MEKAPPTDGLGLDDIGKMCLALRIEEKYGVPLLDSTMINHGTIGELADYVTEYDFGPADEMDS